MSVWISTVVEIICGTQVSDATFVYFADESCALF